MAADIATRHLERISGDIDRIDVHAWQQSRARDGDAAGAGAHIEQAPHACRIDPRREAPLDELGKRRARDEDAWVHLDARAGEPGDTGEIGGWDALADAALDELLRALQRG